jgi:uncharacterized protein involved in outer membrane biogenesis
MSRGRKIALGIVVVLALVLLVLVIVVPMLVNVDRYRPQVVALLEEETGKPAQIRHLSLTVFPSVSIRIDDFKLGNPRGFPPGDFLDVRRISVVVDAGALWDRQVVIKSLQLDDPTINLLSDRHGHWNFENQAQKSVVKQTSAGTKPLFTLGTIGEVTVKGAHVTGADAVAPDKAGPAYFEGRGLTTRLQQVDLNAFTAAGSGALPREIGAPTPSFAQFPSLWGATILYAAPSSQPAAEGTLSADVLRFQQIEATSLKSKLRLFAKEAYFDDLSFNFCNGHAVGALSLNFGGPNLRYATNARITNVDMAKLLEAFPDMKGKMTGKMEGNAKIVGEVPRTPAPLAGVQGTGQVTIRNGQLPSLQLNKNLMSLARLANLGLASGDPSSFSSLSADFNIADQKITSKKITLVGNGVNVDASGTLGVVGAGSLDYQGVAGLAAGQNAVSDLLAGLSGAKQENGKLTFPFAVAGTLDAPKFSLKSGSAASRLGALTGTQGSSTQTGQQQPADVVKGLSGLFKKKKQTTPPQ